MQVLENVTIVLENNSHLELKDYLYVLESKNNLILISSLNKQNYSNYFNTSVFIRNNNSFICLGPLVNPFSYHSYFCFTYC